MSAARATTATIPVEVASWITKFVGGDGSGRRVLDEMLARLRLQPASTIDLPSVSLMLSYARQGLGISLVPGLALAHAI